MKFLSIFLGLRETAAGPYRLRAWVMNLHPQPPSTSQIEAGFFKKTNSRQKSAASQGIDTDAPVLKYNGQK